MVQLYMTADKYDVVDLMKFIEAWFEQVWADLDGSTVPLQQYVDELSYMFQPPALATSKLRQAAVRGLRKCHDVLFRVVNDNTDLACHIIKDLPPDPDRFLYTKGYKCKECRYIFHITELPDDPSEVPRCCPFCRAAKPVWQHGIVGIKMSY